MSVEQAQYTLHIKQPYQRLQPVYQSWANSQQSHINSCTYADMRKQLRGMELILVLAWAIPGFKPLILAGRASTMACHVRIFTMHACVCSRAQVSIGDRTTTTRCAIPDAHLEHHAGHHQSLPLPSSQLLAGEPCISTVRHVTPTHMLALLHANAHAQAPALPPAQSAI